MALDLSKVLDRITRDHDSLHVMLREATIDVYGALSLTNLQDVSFQVADSFATQGMVGTPPPWYQQNLKRGEFIPAYLDEVALRWIRDRSRILCTNNEFALAGIGNRVNYVVGEGLSYTAVATDRKIKRACALADDLQVFIDTFTEINDVEEMEADTVARMDEDGEAFIRLFYQDDGMTYLRNVEPEHVCAPMGNGWGPEYSFGVETDPRDVETIRAYHIVENPLESWSTTRVNEKEIVHFKLNTKRNSKRGLPSFYPVEQNLRRCEDLLASMTSMAKARAKIALIRKLTGVTNQAATDLVRQLTAIRVSDPAISDTVNIERMRYATTLTSPANVEYEIPSYSVGASDFVEVLQAELRAVA